MSMNYKKFIQADGLFLFSLKNKQKISEAELDSLLDQEFSDWISSLYWLEGVAAKYAASMAELFPEERDAWLKILADEVKHQSSLGQWFFENSIIPMPPSAFVKMAEVRVLSLNEEIKVEKIKAISESTQIFFEEALQAVLRWRIHKIVDRPLRALLYQIYRDESRHLAVGRRLLDLSPGEALSKRGSLFFPTHLLRDYPALASELQESSETFLSTIRQSDPYRPPGILAQFESLPGYHCYGCCPFRQDGVLLEPKISPDGNEVQDLLIWGKRFEGFNGMVHGGALATTLDELMGYASILLKQSLTVTQNLQISYLKPVLIQKEYQVSARIIESSDRVFRISGTIHDEKLRPCAEATGNFYRLDRMTADRLIPSLSKHPTLQSLLGIS
jgi:acyl-coenzyme A thioesterase PaaI-like protein